MSNHKNQDNNRRGKNRGFLCGLISGLLVVSLTYGVYAASQGYLETIFSKILNKGDTSAEFQIDENAQVGGRIPPDREQIQHELNKKVEQSMINISMNTFPKFQDGKSKGDLMIINEEINNYTQIIEIYREDNNDLIYRSGGVPVGSKIETAKLNVELKKGTYDCVAYFIAVNDKGEAIGRAGAKIKILIEN